MKNFILLIALASTTLLAADEPKIVRLTPPVISPKSISVEYTCMRPTRDGGFNISVRQYDNDAQAKTIVNCYGHGSAGFSTLFGSVERAIELFENGIPNKSVPIRVIGSGCMGLVSAIELTKRGYKVAGIYTKGREDSASWKAAGYFSLVSKNLTPEDADQLYDLGVKTFMVYQQIEQGEHSFLSKGCARFLPIYCHANAGKGLKFLVDRHLIPPPVPVTLDFGNGVTHSDMYEYKTFFIDTGKLMVELNDEVEKLSIPIKIKEVHTFYDVKEKVVFNCAGLGGAELNEDTHMDAVRGHLIALNSKSGDEHMDYMISTSMLQGNLEESLYLMPKTSLISAKHPRGVKCWGVLGTTFVAHAGDMSEKMLKELDRKEFKRLLDRASLFFWGHTYE